MWSTQTIVPVTLPAAPLTARHGYPVSLRVTHPFGNREGGFVDNKAQIAYRVEVVNVFLDMLAHTAPSPCPRYLRVAFTVGPELSGLPSCPYALLNSRKFIPLCGNGARAVQAAATDAPGVIAPEFLSLVNAGMEASSVDDAPEWWSDFLVGSYKFILSGLPMLGSPDTWERRVDSQALGFAVSVGMVQDDLLIVRDYLASRFRPIDSFCVENAILGEGVVSLHWNLSAGSRRKPEYRGLVLSRGHILVANDEPNPSTNWMLDGRGQDVMTAWMARPERKTFDLDEIAR